MRYNILKLLYLSFCGFVLLHNVPHAFNFSDVQKNCAYLKRRQFIGILGPNVAFNFRPSIYLCEINFFKIEVNEQQNIFPNI